MVRVVCTVLGAELGECSRCEVLEDELERVIAEKNYLQQIILQRTGFVAPETTDTETQPSFQPVSRSRYIPWHLKRREIEKKRRDQRKEREVETKPNLSEGEAIFEKSLNASH